MGYYLIRIFGALLSIIFIWILDVENPSHAPIFTLIFLDSIAYILSGGFPVLVSQWALSNQKINIFPFVCLLFLSIISSFILSHFILEINGFSVCVIPLFFLAKIFGECCFNISRVQKRYIQSYVVTAIIPVSANILTLILVEYLRFNLVYTILLNLVLYVSSVIFVLKYRPFDKLQFTYKLKLRDVFRLNYILAQNYTKIYLTIISLISKYLGLTQVFIDIQYASKYAAIPMRIVSVFGHKIFIKNIEGDREISKQNKSYEYLVLVVFGLSLLGMIIMNEDKFNMMFLFIYLTAAISTPKLAQYIYGNISRSMTTIYIGSAIILGSILWIYSSLISILVFSVLILLGFHDKKFLASRL